jgi:hypothetical protein
MDLDRLWNSGIRFYINENIHVLEKEILAVRDGYMVYVAWGNKEKYPDKQRLKVFNQ